MSKSEAQILANVLDNSRQLTLWYLSKLKDVDVYRTFDVEGKHFASVIWEIAHLAVSENFLILRATGGEKISIPWARMFGLGSAVPVKEECPSYEEVWKTFKEIHQKAIDHIKTLSDEDLDKPTLNGVNFGGEDSIRSVIMHCIRHESTHTGHLGWLCKLHDIKTI